MYIIWKSTHVLTHMQRLMYFVFLYIYMFVTEMHLVTSDDQLDRRASDTNSQVSGPASDASDRGLEDLPVEQPAAPAAPAAILMEALLAITQALKLSNTALRSEIRPPTFNSEGDLTLFLKQFEDVADANG